MKRGREGEGGRRWGEGEDHSIYQHVIDMGR